TRDQFEFAESLPGEGACVRLEVADHHVLSEVLQAVALVQHPDRLADARREAEQDGEVATLRAALLLLQALQELLGSGWAVAHGSLTSGRRGRGQQARGPAPGPRASARRWSGPEAASPPGARGCVRARCGRWLPRSSALAQSPGRFPRAPARGRRWRAR